MSQVCFAAELKERTLRSKLPTRADSAPMGEGDQHHGHLAHGRGRPAPRSPRPWARATSTTVTSPMGEGDQHHGHLAHGRGRPAPRSPRLGRGQSIPVSPTRFDSCPLYSCDIRVLDHIPLVSSRSELLSKF
ncbi:hypothetical protein Bca52824_057779 [Brassica carinata]|uniref:Uncharacterized protein n=1 Tax=Brassica carinata TaxID=52824 RepID=A0A8X7QR23_BRACI|nr:hypothetical protein Bca52824_057779 [Brassica carinata]